MTLAKADAEEANQKGQLILKLAFNCCRFFNRGPGKLNRLTV